MVLAPSVKLSPALKALIAAPHALGKALPAPCASALQAALDQIRSTSETNGSTSDTWLTLVSAATVTINSPETLCRTFDYVMERSRDVEDQVRAAGVIREAALKSISFSGIPRTINALNAFREHLPDAVRQGLSGKSTRGPDSRNIDTIASRGKALWDAIYEPHSVKLLNKLSASHPDLPVHILNSHYGALLSDPFVEPPLGHFKVGRLLTSVVAIACLRTQQGVMPQVTSHVFGLKKALLEGGGAEAEPPLKGGEWLTSDEGVEWILNSTDELSEVIGQGRTSFAAPMERAKL